MLTFGIIAEGPNDQTVIKNILLGYFADQEEPVINFIQPPRPLTEKPGGWGNVFQSLKRRDYEALQFNDYLVVHIDTDVQDEYKVSRREGGKELSIPERVERVIARLKLEIDATFLQANGERILFAIAVETIECWLLPLLYHDDKKRRKTTGCLKSANVALRKANQKPLSVEKNIIAYENASSGYRKRKTLLELHNKNPSLELFVKQLDAIAASLPGG